MLVSGDVDTPPKRNKAFGQIRWVYEPIPSMYMVYICKHLRWIFMVNVEKYTVPVPWMVWGISDCQMFVFIKASWMFAGFASFEHFFSTSVCWVMSQSFQHFEILNCFWRFGSKKENWSNWHTLRCENRTLWGQHVPPVSIPQTRIHEVLALGSLACYLVAGHVTGADGFKQQGSLGFMGYHPNINTVDGSEKSQGQPPVGGMKPCTIMGYDISHINWWVFPNFWTINSTIIGKIMEKIFNIYIYT